MKSPLPKHMYANPIKELYSPWSFYTRYFPDPVEPQLKKHPKLVNIAADFFQVVVGSATAIIVGNLGGDYSSVKNRTAVKTHIWRERNTALAFKAKVRDGFTCQICRVSFPELYGKLGVGFAEVHHIVQLSSLNATAETTLAQLLTVCANCHRMLHKLNGKKSDIGILKKAFTGKWPSTVTT